VFFLVDKLAHGYAPLSLTVRIPPILVGLCVLKVIDPATYGQAKRGELPFDRIAQVLDLKNWHGGG
jgi:hypothetical protein